MEKRSVWGTLRFIFVTVVLMVLVFSAVAVTIMNVYKPALKVNIGDSFIGYFSDKQQFDEVYATLVAEKEQASSSVKVYLDVDPVFQECYIRSQLYEDQNVYTNLRAEIKTEYTIYNVAVNNETQMTFCTEDEANKYVESLKSEVSSLNVAVCEQKVSELGETTSIERADSILKDIVSRNKPVTTTYQKATSTNATVSQETALVAAAQGGIWPTTAHYISSRYGWRSEGFHTGTDIAGKAGDPIYAYKSGLVTFSGWNSNGYGYLIKIDHGNGVSTWYAHCSKLYVTAGETVNQGDTIAAMGSTGYSTGNHLHFEVRINGSSVDSYPYIAGK